MKEFNAFLQISKGQSKILQHTCIHSFLRDELLPNQFQKSKVVRQQPSMNKRNTWKVEEKYSDMLNMKALVGIRIIFMGKEFEW